MFIWTFQILQSPAECFMPHVGDNKLFSANILATATSRCLPIAWQHRAATMQATRLSIRPVTTPARRAQHSPRVVGTPFPHRCFCSVCFNHNKTCTRRQGGSVSLVRERVHCCALGVVRCGMLLCICCLNPCSFILSFPRHASAPSKRSILVLSHAWHSKRIICKS